jgi:hypothetical protein
MAKQALQPYDTGTRFAWFGIIVTLGVIALLFGSIRYREITNPNYVGGGAIAGGLIGALWLALAVEAVEGGGMLTLLDAGTGGLLYAGPIGAACGAICGAMVKRLSFKRKAMWITIALNWALAVLIASKFGGPIAGFYV